MSAAHDPAHELLLAEVLSGERSPDDPAVAGGLHACTECQARLARLRRTASALVRAGSEQRDALQELRRLTVPGEADVLPALERMFAREAPRRRPWLWAAAAALLLSAGAWWTLRATRPPAVEPPIYLGEKLQLLAPIGSVEEFGPFTWRFPVEQVVSYTLRIYRDEDAAQREPLLEQKRLKDSTWTPDPDVLRELPNSIRWAVEALDEFGNTVQGGLASGSASRSSH